MTIHTMDVYGHSIIYNMNIVTIWPIYFGEALMYQCKNCNGKIMYLIEERKLACESCDSRFDISDYTNESLTAEKSYEINTYVCPQCNGEIVSADEQSVGFCPYCGTQVGLEKHLVNAEKPKHILPFSKTKSDCREAYAKAIEKVPFLPQEMKEPGALEHFIGVYMPFWLYNAQTGCHFSGKGHTSKKIEEGKKEYLITDYYTKEYDYEGDFKRYPKDASLCFDDNLSENILPYSDGSNDLEPFHPAYLCGFYGDLATVPQETYQETVLNEILEYHHKTGAWDDLDKPNAKQRLKILEKSKETARMDAELGMFPVWFMTYRKKNRVSYGIVNGATGSMAMDFPVDIRAFLKSTLLLTVPLFLACVLWLPAFSIKVLNSVAWFLSILSMIAASAMQRKRYVRSQNIRTKSSITGTGTNHSADQMITCGSIIVALSIVLFSIARLIFGKLEFFFTVAVFSIVNIRLIVALLLLLFMLIRFSKRTNMAVLVSWVSAMLTGLIARLDPPQDIYYYCAVLLAGLSITCTLLLMTKIQKDFAERKLPFFERRELKYNE